MPRPIQYIVSTDLDGTLLDHHTYSWRAAESALQQCHELNIPIIINTSKAQSEVTELLAQLGFKAPFVMENGSAMSIPLSFVGNVDAILSGEYASTIDGDNLLVRFGVDRRVILDFIQLIRNNHDWKFEGFADWSVEKIAECTGLSLENAGQASQKHYSEPFIWNDSDSNFKQFQSRVEQAGLKCMKGGRFFHLQGQTSKALPLQWVLSNIENIFENQDSNCLPKLICLGDNHNDVDMLNIADYPVCVRSPVADYPNLTCTKKIIQTHAYGPEGWAEAIHSILTSK